MFKTKSAGLVHYYNDNHKITPRKQISSIA